MSKAIQTDDAPKAVGPYSQAVESCGYVFFSGQIGIDPKTNELVEGIENQTHQVMKNLIAVLKAAGCEIGNVVKTTIYVSDMNNYAKVNEIYGSYLGEVKPARATVQVARLPKDCLVEIDAIAEKECDCECGECDCDENCDENCKCPCHEECDCDEKCREDCKCGCHKE